MYKYSYILFGCNVPRMAKKTFDIISGNGIKLQNFNYTQKALCKKNRTIGS